MEKLIELHDLIVRTIGNRSTKHRSYIESLCPAKADSIKVGREMMYEINSFYNESELVSWSMQKMQNMNFKNEISMYKSSVENFIFPEYVDPSIENNFVVDLTRSSTHQKKEIRELYPLDSIPNITLDLIDFASANFDHSSQESAIVIVNLLAKLYPWMQLNNAKLIELDVPPVEASRQTFIEISKNVGKMLESTRIPEEYVVDSSISKPSLLITSRDKEGLVKASRLQERPFNESDLLFGRDLLLNNESLKSSLIIFHKLLVDFGEYKLRTTPNRSEYTLLPFEEIFLSEDGKLIPNIRFLQILVKNWIPSIAKTARVHELVDPMALEVNDILEGIQQADNIHKIFQMNIFMFNQLPDDNYIRYDGHIPKICPAKKVITIVGGELLPLIYNKLKLRSDS